MKLTAVLLAALIAIWLVVSGPLPASAQSEPTHRSYTTCLILKVYKWLLCFSGESTQARSSVMFTTDVPTS